jgi:hypothetical protein
MKKMPAEVDKTLLERRLWPPQGPDGMQSLVILAEFSLINQNLKHRSVGQLFDEGSEQDQRRNCLFVPS